MIGYQRVGGRKDKESRHGEENIDANEDEFGRLERNLVKKEIRRNIYRKQ
jgi:hypothetical protein